MTHCRRAAMLFLALAASLACSRAARAQTNPDLEPVLTLMDSAARTFRTTEASFEWDQYSKVVDETDVQKGNVYFRRVGDEVEMAADIVDPDKKYVLFGENKVQVYQPKIEQVTVYNTGKNRAEFESFIVLGFGGSGHDMLRSFDVQYLGKEVIAGTGTAKLDLVPKSPKVRNTFAHIVLWIDTTRGVSLQQQLFEPSGDYRLAKYSNIQINQKIPDNVFKLKTTGRTKFVSPQG